MKTSVEIPDALLRRAKRETARRGVSLRQFVTEALEDKLKTLNQSKPWMKHVGKLKHLRKETRRISRLVEEQFERIDPETWN